MAPVTLDPRYKHRIGEFTCRVDQCHGHRRSWQPSLHRLYTDHGLGTGKRRRITADTLVQEGKHLPEEVQSLIEQKKAAVKQGDKQEARRLRQLLRKLDYKRYLHPEK